MTLFDRYQPTEWRNHPPIIRECSCCGKRVGFLWDNERKFLECSNCKDAVDPLVFQVKPYHAWFEDKGLYEVMNAGMGK